MQLFYAHQVEGTTAFLDQEETRHCIKTLRKNIHDVISLTDGLGNMYEGKIVDFNKKSCTIQIIQRIETTDQRNFRLHLAIAPTKNISRLEWFLEKTTELGIDEITFILCQRSERKNIRLDRLEKVVLAAAKQSLKSIFPKINDLTKFKDFLPAANNATFKGIAHCNTPNLPHLKKVLNPNVKEVLLLIGPEGDFSEEEVAWAKDSGFEEIGLGTSRLRTETAGIAACHTVHLLHI
ncbi:MULTISPECIES: 16S rRNA (uracil(1498)-N(3))-methyltransferase [unclassified Aureispira]|uniref:16S rRNA (uracil(1498)-N(3))-methyltransferase n=1 Tax=unclassified Aureispira TaxID=2649989 RepID=UPI000696FAA6|nr:MULTISPECIES: 16S rRNA (uracil(1498)-N(3))-methyltransferase [unclassified Aureispira]WMX14558.1 16S rRNA (uracil(1498)-N(3))-methyltransferase [Aureispira sp. CCB-E]